ncbi:MAG TPA: winged helix-turn-helix transcriptional regulator [Actinomycetes bacterium]
MSRRTYGQYCGLAHALELVGERWALLVIRDLLPGPKRFTDLRNGLPRIPTNILSARLKELEASGVIQRRLLPRPQGSVVYELTDYGRELDDVVLRLSLWGVRSLGQPRPDDVVTTDSLIMALRTTFRRDAAAGLHLGYEVRVGDIVVHALVDDGKVEVGQGPLPRPDLVIITGPELRALLAGELSPGEAVAGGAVRLTGDPALLDRFVEAFHVPPPPASAA